jgi:alpha/beta hydrolase family protein
MLVRMIGALLSVILGSSVAFAEVAKVTVANRVTVAGGQAFGASGPYEKLTGTIEFALDPTEKHNRRIVDLGRAARASDGRVHFTSDLMVLRPVDPTKGNGVLLFEVINRGRLGLLTRINGASGADSPMAPADFGNGFLMREGYTLVIVGWEFDIQPRTIRVDAPAIPDLVEAITVGFVPDARANEAVLDDAPMYEPTDPADAASTMTVRDHYWERPTPVARTKWRFVTGQAGPARVALDEGFEPGRLYQVTFKARGARVVGVGLAAIRDAAAAFRYRTDLPIHGTSAYVFGASQDGRFLRQFLYDGFNADERNRRVFDAVWPHIAGSARGSFNERYGMPVGGSVMLTPTRFPFTTDDQAFNGERGSLLQLYTADQRPKIFFTNTPVEYWGGGRAAALIHTSADGKRDLPIPDNVRIYLLAGTQHGEAAFPPRRTRGEQVDNPVPQREVMRALMRGLYLWASQGVAPPESRYPKRADGTLTPIAAVKFPTIPGVADPRSIAGPGQVRNGKVEMLPHLVPQVDADGNDASGIRVPDISVPVATNTGWNFRSAAVGGATEIYNLLGSYIPFASTKAEREAKKDQRLSIAERYRDRDDYLSKLRAAAQDLVRGRYLLPEDVENVVTRGQAQWALRSGANTTAAR